MRKSLVSHWLLFSFLLSSIYGERVVALETAPPVISVLPAQTGVPSAQTLPMADGSSAFAQDFTSSGGTNRNRTLGAIAGMGEYVSGNYPGAVLIPVTILGPVPKQGIHHIPTRTSLVKFLSLAGGVTPNVDLSEVVIKRMVGREKSPNGKNNEAVSQEEIIKIDLGDLLESAGSRGPLLQQDDIVVIKENHPLIDNNTILAISVISSLLGIVVSSIVISNELKKK